MQRIKYLLGILSSCAALLYAGFGMLSWNAPALGVFDQTMPFALSAIHSLVALALFRSSYTEHLREELRLQRILSMLTTQQSSFRAEELAKAANISLAEAHEFLLKPSTQKRIVAITQHEHIVVRAFARHSLN